MIQMEFFCLLFSGSGAFRLLGFGHSDLHITLSGKGRREERGEMRCIYVENHL